MAVKDNLIAIHENLTTSLERQAEALPEGR